MRNGRICSDCFVDRSNNAVLWGLQSEFVSATLTEAITKIVVEPLKLDAFMLGFFQFSPERLRKP